MSGQAHDGVALIKPGQTYVGKQGFTYGAGASAETVGAQHSATAGRRRRWWNLTGPRRLSAPTVLKTSSGSSSGRGGRA